MNLMRQQAGFSMIELVVALSVAAVVVALVVMFLDAPMQSYLTQNRRSELIYSAHSMQRWLADDVHGALPNTLRTLRNGNVQVIEVNTSTGPIAYLCDEGAGTMTRYSGYTYSANFADHDTAVELAGATSGLVVRNVTTCAASARVGLNKQRDLLSIKVVFGIALERLRSFNQFAVEQLP